MSRSPQSTPKKVRVLVNGLHSKSGGGVTYMKNILPLLDADPRLEVHACFSSDQLDLFRDVLGNVEIHEVRGRMPLWRLIVAEQIGVPRLAGKFKADVIFSPANYGPLCSKNGVILLRNALSVAFVERRFSKLAYWFLVYVGTQLSVWRAKRVAAVSRYALQSTVGKGSYPADHRFAIIPHGINSMFTAGNFAERSDTDLLVVSDIYVQKNLHRLIEALPDIRKIHPGMRLRVAGAALDPGYMDRLKQLIKANGLDEAIQFLGSCSADVLVDLYQSCAIFVFPSTVETFGNPLVEAMACGAPIACSNSAAMPEVAGEAALYFDPSNVEDMVNVISHLLGSEKERERLAALARGRARSFSWEKSASAMADLLVLSAQN